MATVRVDDPQLVQADAGDPPGTSKWIPEEPTLQNYRDLWDRLDFLRYFFNSTIVAVGVTAGNLLFCSMLGYALAKLSLPGKRALLAVMLGDADGSGVVTLVAAVRDRHEHEPDQHTSRLDPADAGAFGVFLMRQYILGIPDDLLDAARVDGAGEYRIFFRIVLPLWPGARHARRADVPGQLEQLPVAPGRRQHRGHVHAAGRPGVVRIGQQQSNVACRWPARSSSCCRSSSCSSPCSAM